MYPPPHPMARRRPSGLKPTAPGLPAGQWRTCAIGSCRRAVTSQSLIAAVPVGRGEVPAVGAVGDAPDVIRMPVECLRISRPVVGIPDPNDLVRARRGEVPAVGAVGHGVDLAGVPGRVAGSPPGPSPRPRSGPTGRRRRWRCAGRRGCTRRRRSGPGGPLKTRKASPGDETRGASQMQMVPSS